ncbi:MAG TPA: discoidin domain-containing protein [Tepidisphaeraceae bacterium]|nr:discoidin domain-containing protein [Tepidisphaeraceae bacterium]
MSDTFYSGVSWGAAAIGILMSCLTLTSPAGAAPAQGHVLDKQKLLAAQTFWDNRDWDWYERNIPFFESPDADIDTTYYYRWELVTKHLVYGSPETGYCYTEFMDRPFWSGRYGAISCAAGHHLYEVRWLKDPRYAEDYLAYWFRTPGAEPRRYSCWLDDAVWAVHMVHPDRALLAGLLPDMVRNYQGWEREHFVPEAGMFWQTGMADGMETNINSRQTKDGFSGAPGYRTTLNSYMWADALAIKRIAKLAGDEKLAAEYGAKAAALKKNVQEKLWDKRREFFFEMFQHDEEKDGFTVKANTLTYQTGKFAGSPHGREEYNYSPWQFNLPDAGYEGAWQFLMDRNYFFSDFGPTVTERNDPLFLISPNCCVWSGQSWPYATTQTLVAMANLLNSYPQKFVSKEDYFKLLDVYARTHRKDGRPYIAEAANPDTGSWQGHDNFNHSEHYFHSGYTDLIITGLAGLRPRADDVIEVNPLAPESWDYFALDDVAYRGHRVAIVWDKAGRRYGLGAGLHVLVDGKVIASAPALGKLTAKLPPAADAPVPPRLINYAVNNEGAYFPRAIASYTNEKTSPEKLNDGNYWYAMSPPNRWTCEGSQEAVDWCGIDFGIKRPIDTVKLYLLDDDGGTVRAPSAVRLEYWDGGAWANVPGQQMNPGKPEGHRANVITFPKLEATKLRAVLEHDKGVWCGVSEFEAWGGGTLPLAPAPAPAGNLAANPSGKGFPQVSASFTSRFDDVKEANDGKVVFSPGPHNRWTAYESPNKSDWLQIDFGAEKTVGRVELYLYDDHGGVQAPASYQIQFQAGEEWKDVPNQKKSPASPAGGKVNAVTFPAVKASKIRVVFEHRAPSRSGVTEIDAWEK